MHVLVTGGAGFIGSHTVDLLLERGHQVRVLDSLEPPVHPKRHRPTCIPATVDFLQGDVADQHAVVRALDGIEVVFHLAAYQDYLTDFSRFARVNDMGTALLYETVVNRRLPVRKVILASSQAVYGEGQYRCPAHGIQHPPPRPVEQLMRQDWDVKCPVCQGKLETVPTDEQRVNPSNQYAVSKYAQELYALTLGNRYGIPTVALRYSITQGPRQSFFNAYSGILRTFALQLLNRRPPTIYEDGCQLRDYVHVRDVARANILVMESDAAGGRVFNVGGGEVATVRQYADLLVELTDSDQAPTITGEFRWGDVRHIVSDCSAIQELGWRPTLSLRETATDYLDWAKTQPELPDGSVQAIETMRRMGVIRQAADREAVLEQ